MKTTLNAQELRDLDACLSGYQTFIKAHGEKTVTFSQALESNGIDDALWYLTKITLDDEQLLDLSTFALDCAEHVLHIYEAEHPDDSRPRNAIETAREHLAGDATFTELHAAQTAATRAAARNKSSLVADAAAFAAANAYTVTTHGICAQAAAARGTLAAARAALAAARAARADDERDWQTAQLLKLIEKW